MDPASTRPARAGGQQQLDIIVADPTWLRLVPNVRAVVTRAAKAAQLSGTVLLADDRMVQRLNARDRGRNRPTNVLAYEAPGPGLSGQIVMAAGVVRREAAAAARRPAHHLAHLVVHGALHLAGYDHHGAGQARRMEMAEARILRQLGMPNPWKQR
jgi:probable rRNA maturation factor